MLSLTRNMALDYAREGIRVNAICPGTIDSEMVRTAARTEGGDIEANLRRYGAFHPIGRLGVPADIAEAVLFLASERASFITGEHLVRRRRLHGPGRVGVERGRRGRAMTRAADLPLAELRRHVGDVSQLVSVRTVRLTDGNEDGVRAVDVRVTGGLSALVLARPGDGPRPGLGRRAAGELAEHDRHRRAGPLRRDELAAQLPRRAARHVRAPERRACRTWIRA